MLITIEIALAYICICDL